MNEPDVSSPQSQPKPDASSAPAADAEQATASTGSPESMVDFAGWGTVQVVDDLEGPVHGPPRREQSQACEFLQRPFAETTSPQAVCT